MFIIIKCDNKDIFCCLLREGWACVPVGNGNIGVKDGFRKIEPKRLEKYKEVFGAEINEDGPELAELAELEGYRTWKEYNPRWLTGMCANNMYEKYFGKDPSIS